MVLVLQELLGFRPVFGLGQKNLKPIGWLSADLHVHTLP